MTRLTIPTLILIVLPALVVFAAPQAAADEKADALKARAGFLEAQQGKQVSTDKEIKRIGADIRTINDRKRSEPGDKSRLIHLYHDVQDAVGEYYEWKLETLEDLKAKHPSLAKWADAEIATTKKRYADTDRALEKKVTELNKLKETPAKKAEKKPESKPAPRKHSTKSEAERRYKELKTHYETLIVRKAPLTERTRVVIDMWKVGLEIAEEKTGKPQTKARESQGKLLEEWSKIIAEYEEVDRATDRTNEVKKKLWKLWGKSFKYQERLKKAGYKGPWFHAHKVR